MYSMVKDWRNKRNMMYDTQRYSVENYFTDVQQKKEMRHSFGDDLLNNLHLLPDPLKKNLADSLITSDEPKRKPNKEFLNMETVEDRFKMEGRPIKEPEQPPMAPFSGISNFFSGVMNVISGAVFQWRPRSPAKYYDCFDDSNVSHQGSPASWQPSSAEDQNKNERAQDLISNVQTEFKSDMHKDCRSAVAQCEDKLNKVRLLLSTKPVEAPKYRSRRPRKVFVEPGNVEESFEDAFTPEDFVSLPNEPYVEYYSPFQSHREELTQTDSPKMRTKVAPVHETTEIVKTLPVNEVSNSDKNCTVVKSDNLKTESVKNYCISEKLENKIVNIVDINVKVEEKPKLNIMELQKSTETKSDKEEINSKIISKETNNIPIENAKEELISSCKDKLSKLKALMQERRKKNTKTVVTSSDSVLEVDKTNNKIPEPTKTVPIEKTQDKRFKNPCRRTEKRRKGKLRRHMLDDMMFANEIHSDDLSSAENSPSVNSLDNLLVKLKRDSMGSLPITPVGTPKLSLTPPSVTNNTEYFDEISGRFRSTSTTDSDDSFQIVFNDSPKTRKRMPSDCDSEDSFIVFEDSPDSCYTSHDVFGEESEDESDFTDSDSDLSDSGVPVTKLAHNLSRTISDLTDDSLYEDKCVDEVDCAVQSVCEEIPSEDIVDVSDEESEKKETGLLLTEAKKLLRKDQPKKKVQFSARPPEVHVMRVWSFAARQARKGHWERFALDRDRFKRRIADVDMAVSWVLKPQHRKRVMFQRFMPWWHAQRRKEIAERKQQKEEEEKRLAEEKIKREEEENRERIKKEEEEKRIAAEEEKRLAEEKERKNKIRQELKNVTDPKTKSLMIFVHNVKRLSIDKTKPLVANKCNTESKSDSNSKESETEIICNGNDNKESSKPDKEIIVDANCNDSNGNKKINGVINDYIKNGNEMNEQKHEVIVTKCDKTDIQQSNIGSEVPKKEIIIQNGKIHNDINGDLNKTICNENLKVLNGSNVQIKVSSETVGGT